MAIREIVTLPDPVLRRKTRKVTSFNDKLQTLIDDMIETMRDEPGVGLAANQVGVSQRVLVVEYVENEEEAENEDAPKKLYALVNPEIKRASSEMVVGVEGCLSIPGYVGELERHEAITIKGQNRHGQPVTIKAKGWLARIFQHEMDHLNGILFVDRTDKVWMLQETPEEAIGD
jgi:peptide deformylase